MPSRNHYDIKNNPDPQNGLYLNIIKAKHHGSTTSKS